MILLRKTRTYVGFGFGPIQAGLFTYEAFASGNFQHLVIAEVAPEVVAALRRANGYFGINIAHANRVEHAQVGPIEIEDPAQESDRQRLIEAIVEAEEIGIALPSVASYVSAGPGSLHHILAQGLRKKAALGGPRVVVYTAENHNHAAEILAAQVLAEIPGDEQDLVRGRVQFLNTVIGKMSGTISNPAEIREQGLIPITPGEQRAFLVEAFNRILISKIKFNQTEGEPPFHRGITVFEEKEELLPFEEAKLYGHNAAHALAAYIGAVRGVLRIADLRHMPGVLPFLRAALIQESGEALIRKHGGVDPLFTTVGYTQYADDLLERMTNPHLQDTVERVGRDPARKLGWDDRLIGTMRLALAGGVEPRRYAMGVAAALTTMDRSLLDEGSSPAILLNSLWSQASSDKSEQETVLGLIEAGRRRLKHWLESEDQHLERLF